MRTRGLLGLGLLSATVLACDDPARLRVLAPDLTVSPEELDFGVVPLGATRRIAVELRNEGTSVLGLRGVRVDGAFSVDPESLGALAIAPGASVELDVGFRPSRVEAVTSAIVLDSDDPDSPALPIPVAGEGAEGLLSAQPAEIDFGSVLVGTTVAREVVLANLGLAPASGRLVAEGFERPGFFVSPSGPLERDIALPERGTLTLDLEYRPLEPGDHGGRLRLATCEGRCGVEVRVRALGVTPTVRLEPPLVDFGDVALGAARVAQVVVRNEGTAPVQVLSVDTRGSAALAAAAAAPLPVDLGPGDRLALDLSFTPADATELAGAVEVGLEGGSQPRLEAAVRGRGVGPRFVVQPQRLTFGVVTEPAATARTALGVNLGSAEVRVEGVSIVGDPALALDTLPGLPIALGRGEALPVSVRFTPSRLGVATATITFRSSDPLTPSVRLPVVAGFAERECRLQIDPETVGFGSLVPGFARTRGVRIANRGERPCRLVSGVFRSPADEAVALLGPSPFPSTLEAGSTLDLSFRYAPTAERETKAVFGIRTDEPLFPLRNLSFVGTGAGYDDLFTRPRTLVFGSVARVCPEEARVLEIVNAGTRAVEIDAVSLEAPSSELRLEPVGLPLVIPGGAVRTVVVTYDPTDVGRDMGDVVIELRDRPFALVVPVEGVGSDAPEQVESFVQEARRDVDVLFVVDDSCSMVDDQQALARNFRAFIQQADVRQVDFRMGVTTTTVLGAGGRLVAAPMTRQTPNLEQEFARQTTVGTAGSGHEQGLEAALGAVLLAEQGAPPNSSLFRASSRKAFVVVSDEDDSSSASPVAYAAELSRRFGRPFAAVVGGGPSGCASSDGSAAPAPRYAGFLAELGGIGASICRDWGETLGILGRAAFGLESRFRLGRRPDPSQPIVVRLNGQPVPTSGWRYDPSDAAIVFDSPPPEGARIEIRFVPACRT